LLPAAWLSLYLNTCTTIHYNKVHYITLHAPFSLATLGRLYQDLAPYLSSRNQPQLVEVIADRNKRVSLRLSDRTSRDLSYCIDIQEALGMLLDARQQWLLQGRDVEHEQQQEQQADEQQQLGLGVEAVLNGGSSSSLQLARSVSCASMSSAGSGGVIVGADRSAASSSASSLAAAAAAAAPRSGRDFFGFLSFGKQGPAPRNLQQQQQHHILDQADEQQQQQQTLACSDAGTADCAAAPETAAAAGSAAAAAAAAAAKVQPSSRAFDAMFGSDNRMGVPGSLHRISAMRNRQGAIYGLTYRCANWLRLCYEHCQ
jgi:hypothetical protein